MIGGILAAAWELLTMASPYILVGLFVAGLLRAIVTPARIATHLGGNTLRSVGLAALSGIPLPLCSCGVLPTAMSLRQQGASKPATVAFLISTPESGIDAIAVTYALLGPFMAIIRPIAAFVTAFVAGAAQIAFGSAHGDPPRSRVPKEGPLAGGRLYGDDATAAEREGARAPKSKGDPTPTEAARRERGGTRPGGLASQLATGLRFAFVTLLRDISGWFLCGILLGGLISYALPADFVHQYLGTGWRAMFVMLAVGIPLYICASASTPIAAALIAKGMSPGAALVFLLAGPATNIASIPLLVKFLGKRAVAIYLLAIAACALLIGAAVNAGHAHWGLPAMALAQHAHHPLPAAVRTACAIALLLLIVALHAPQVLRKFTARHP